MKICIDENARRSSLGACDETRKTADYKRQRVRAAPKRTTQRVTDCEVAQPNEQKIHERVMNAIGQFSEDEWSGLTVVMRDAVQSVSRAS